MIINLDFIINLLFSVSIPLLYIILCWGIIYKYASVKIVKLSKIIFPIIILLIFILQIQTYGPRVELEHNAIPKPKEVDKKIIESKDLIDNVDMWEQFSDKANLYKERQDKEIK